MTRLEIVREAEAWIGTPYRHQASVKGAGSDCLGLLRGVWRAVAGAEPELPPPYSRDWDEVEKRDVLLAAARRHLVERPLGEMAAGDVLLFRMRDGAVAKHLGILTRSGAHPVFVHAYSGHGVVQSSLSLPWRRRVAHVFAFPDLT